MGSSRVRVPSPEAWAAASEFPVRTTSLAHTLEASGSHHVEDEFTEGDLLMATKWTMQYTQVSFDESTQRPAISELGPSV